MRGRSRYGWLTLFGIRASDGLKVRLGRAMSHETARGIALSILRPTQMWSHIDILNRNGKLVERVVKPPIEGSGAE